MSKGGISMASSAPLQGSELIDCARANRKEGLAIATQRCGYGDDSAQFEQELRKAGEAIGVEIQSFDSLIDSSHETRRDLGIEIAPETSSQL